MTKTSLRRDGGGGALRRRFKWNPAADRAGILREGPGPGRCLGGGPLRYSWRSERLQDPEAEIEMMRIYNEWLAGFCAGHPERFAGLAAIPSHSVDAAVDEIKRVAARGAMRGVEIANTHDLKPLFHSDWYPV